MQPICGAANLVQNKAEYTQLMWKRLGDQMRIKIEIMGEVSLVDPPADASSIHHLAAATIYLSPYAANVAVDELCRLLGTGEFLESDTRITAFANVSIMGPWDSVAVNILFSRDKTLMEIAGRRYKTNPSIQKWLEVYVDPFSRIIEGNRYPKSPE